MAVATFASGCGRIGFRPLAGAKDGTTADAAFSAPALIGALSNSAAYDATPAITDDRLEMIFSSDRPPTLGGRDFWSATRTSLAAPWATPFPLTAISTAGVDGNPALSADALTLWGHMNGNVEVASRASRTSSWSPPMPVPSLEGQAGETYPGAVFDSGLQMVVASNRAGNGDIDLYICSRPAVTVDWTGCAAVTELNTSYDDQWPWISADGLVLYFVSNRPGGLGGVDIWFATRADAAATFGAAMPALELNSSGNDTDPWLTSDLRYVVFVRDGDLYEATR